MRNSTRGIVTVLACSLVLALSGCSEDNEAFVKAQQEANSAKDTSGGAAPKDAPRNQADYYKQQQQSKAATYGKSSGYPGAK